MPAKAFTKAKRNLNRLFTTIVIQQLCLLYLYLSIVLPARRMVEDHAGKHRVTEHRPKSLNFVRGEIDLFLFSVFERRS